MAWVLFSCSMIISFMDGVRLGILLRVNVPPISVQVIRPVVGDALNGVAIVIKERGEDWVFFVHAPSNK